MYIVYINKHTKMINILSDIEDVYVAKYVVNKLKSKDNSPYKSLSIIDDISSIVKNDEVNYYYIVENFMLEYLKDR